MILFAFVSYLRFYKAAIKSISLLSLAALVVLGSCTQIQPSVYGTFNAREKTLAVPVSNFGWLPQIKDNLRKEGWDIRVSGSNVTFKDGLLAKNGAARYTMAVECREQPGYGAAAAIWVAPVTLIWICSGCPSLSSQDIYSLTIFDNRDGRELLTYKGPTIVEKNKRDIITQTIVENTR